MTRNVDPTPGVLVTSTRPLCASTICRATNGPSPNPPYRCLFSIIRDITERKRFDVEREDLLHATQRALSLRDDFLMIASHELRSPLTNVSLQLQNLQRMVDRGATRAHLRVLADAAVSEAGRLTSLIDTLLDAQAARGHLELNIVDVDLGELARDVADRMRPRRAIGLAGGGRRAGADKSHDERAQVRAR